uniref:Cilia- and flagella-associated protein 36 n=2 Tax=Schistosoma mansoni TaxID=6183 RepID=A0A3Q0KV22_SCHMA
MNTKGLENFFSDPMVSAHIESFMDAHCSIFTYEKEIYSEHYLTHKEFSEMMKSLLNSSSIHYNQIQEIYTTYKITEDDPCFSSISYIIASWNFELFYQLMTLVNVDLQLEALHYIQQKYGNQFIQMYSNNNDNDSVDNISTPINKNELTDMLLEKSQQKNGMVKTIKQTIQSELCKSQRKENDGQLLMEIDSNATRDIPTKNLINPKIPHEIKPSSFDTVTSSSSSWNHILNLNNSETIHQQKYDNTVRPTEGELIEKQAFLRKQRDLLIEMRQKKREKLFADHVQTLTDKSIVYTNDRDCNSIGNDEHDKVMEKRRKLYEKLKIEVINKSGFDQTKK